MNDQYLWDGTGEADPDVARLEEALRPLRHADRAFDLEAARRSSAQAAVRARRVWSLGLAAAAGLVLAAWVFWPRPAGAPGAWTVVAVDGAVTAGSRAIVVGAAVAEGEVVETGPGARVRLQADGVGTLQLGPRARLGVTRVGEARRWFTLERGVLEADISAAPGVFAVDTPAARAIDLGCRYTLEVAPGGAGRLHVTLGWVALADGDRESLVPAGAMCATQAGAGPGTPYFEGATPAFVEALAHLDRGVAPVEPRALRTVLAEARPLDAISLWHLLARLERGAAVQVYARLAELVPPPPGVTIDAALAGEPAARAGWWAAIGLGDLEDLRVGVRRAR